MAAPLRVDVAQLDRSRVIYTKKQIYSRLPQKHEFELLDGVVHLDQEVGEAIAFMDVREDLWWCKAHVPGQPLLPGVLMLEAAAQIAAFMERYANDDFHDFVGYGGVDNCKFRQTVQPPATMWMVCRRTDARSRRIMCSVQGIVDGTLVFEADVTGLVIPASRD